MLSQDIISQIPILYKELGNKKEVARQLGISSSSVSKYLALYDASATQQLSKPQRKRTPITQEIIDQINILYKQYVNTNQVAKILHISSSTVNKYLSEENLELKEKQKDSRDALFYYIYRLFGEHAENEPISKWNLVQMQKFKNQGISYQAQLLTLKYFFDIQKNPVEKANGSIGIIPYKVSESETYYRNRLEKAKEITEGIKRQLEKDRLEIKYNPSDYVDVRNRRKQTYDMNLVGDDID